MYIMYSQKNSRHSKFNSMLNYSLHGLSTPCIMSSSPVAQTKNLNVRVNFNVTGMNLMPTAICRSFTTTWTKPHLTTFLQEMHT